jgi:transposase
MTDVKRITQLILTTDHSNRRIGLLARCAHSTVSSYRRLLLAAGITWDQAAAMPEERLRRLLSRSQPTPPREFLEPDWLVVEAELRKKGVDRYMLWCEYQAATIRDLVMSYREFCRRLARYKKRFGLVMRQEHRAGEKLFIDFMGGRPHWCDPKTGTRHYAEVFVACLGASNYVYAEAVATQTVPDWLSAHINALEALGGAPEVFVPDNLKAAVLSRRKGELPLLNPAYQALADHFGVEIEPARPRRPKDKPLVELSVKLVHKALIAILRKRTFFSLAELNAALKEVVAGLNARPFRKSPGHSRKSLFELIDEPALVPLPKTRFDYEAFQVGLSVGPDYHVRFDGAAYSVPYTLIGAKVDVRARRHAVEIWRNGERVAIHPRAGDPRARSTDPDHMPAKHRAWHEADQDLVSWADAYGPSARALADHHATADRPKNGRRRTLRQLRELGRVTGRDRFEAACAKALEINGLEPTVIENILKRGLERAPAAQAAQAAPPRMHGNIRGPAYYGQGEVK